MTDHPIVDRDTWTDARRDLLEAEKAFSKAREELTAKRLALPWTEITVDYSFQGPEGPCSLADLFGDASQLIVYHFMLGPGASAGCPMCSLFADHYERLAPHLAARDARLVTISRAPLREIESYRQRMGWQTPWVSSHGTSFNRDFSATLFVEDVEAGTATYNFRPITRHDGGEVPGLTVFHKTEDGRIFRTYAAYARGLERFLGIYEFLDSLPKGRDEAELPYGMAWVRRHDEYDPR